MKNNIKEKNKKYEAEIIAGLNEMKITYKLILLLQKSDDLTGYFRKVLKEEKNHLSDMISGYRRIANNIIVESKKEVK